MSVFETIIIRIVGEQELIIGPLAWTEAGKISGLRVQKEIGVVSIQGDPKQAIDRLVARYEKLFGQISREVCKQAVASILADLKPDEIPASLK
ncbi:MAG: hypothetical protein AAB660_00395 [Patescibacteria group bacterium]